MDPQQPNYDFILNSQPQSKRSPFMPSSGNKNLVAVVFVLVILLVAVIGFAFVSSLGKQNNSDMTLLAARQTELLRISEIGLKDAKDLSVRARVQTLQSFLSSDFTATSAYIATVGGEIKPEELALYKDAKADSDLTSAQQRNSFDEALIAILNEKAGAYKTALSEALSASPEGSTRQKVLNNAAQNIIIFDNAPTAQK